MPGKMSRFSAGMLEPRAISSLHATLHITEKQNRVILLLLWKWVQGDHFGELYGNKNWTKFIAWKLLLARFQISIIPLWCLHINDTYIRVHAPSGELGGGVRGEDGDLLVRKNYAMPLGMQTHSKCATNMNVCKDRYIDAWGSDRLLSKRVMGRLDDRYRSVYCIFETYMLYIRIARSPSREFWSQRTCNVNCKPSMNSEATYC